MCVQIFMLSLCKFYALLISMPCMNRLGWLAGASLIVNWGYLCAGSVHVHMHGETAWMLVYMRGDTKIKKCLYAW